MAATPREAAPIGPRPPELAQDSSVAIHPVVRLNAAVGAARPAVRVLQQIAAEPAEILAAAGLAFLLLLAPRRALLLTLVPAYMLLVQSPMHFEARFALPKDAFTPAFEAVGLVALLAAAAPRALRGASGR